MPYRNHTLSGSFLCIIILLLIDTSLKAQTVDTSKANKFRDFKTEHMWDAKVKVSNLLMLGESKRGVRRIIPITGGTFEGPNIKGEVLPIGADWQTVRTNGDTELNARYLLKTNDGHLIQVINQVLMHNPPKGTNTGMYAKSVVDLEAPVNSPYDHLNHAIFLGTLEVPPFKPGEDPYVIIRVYKVL
jgi:hypothetical protein